MQSQKNIEATYGSCLTLVLRDSLTYLHENMQKTPTAKDITEYIIKIHKLDISDFEEKNLVMRVKRKLSKLSKGGLVIIDHKVTPKKTLENTYKPNFFLNELRINQRNNSHDENNGDRHQSNDTRICNSREHN